MTPAQTILATQIDALLPQTQCTKCGYAGCRPYAEAIAVGAADINQCPPGDEQLLLELATLLGVESKPLDTRFGAAKEPGVAVIDEARCIGCTLCIHACPVDAIVGAAKLMHTVITSDCTGCELCVAPCPVACIVVAPTGKRATGRERGLAADRARARYQRRQARLDRQSRSECVAPENAKQITVRRAMERARSRLAQRGPSG